MRQGPVRAGGGVVWRRSGPGSVDGPIEVLVVHRPRYDDWSLPKGKAERGETDEVCARREVEEETGLVCELGDHLADVAYIDRRGRPKLARYWAMRPLRGQFTPSAEVDEVRWLSVPDALDLLSYADDGEVVTALTVPSGPLPGDARRGDAGRGDAVAGQ